MAISFIAETIAGSSDGSAVTTSSIDTSGANLIIIAEGTTAQGTFATPTDSKSNSWTALTTFQESGTGTILKFYYSFATSVGSGHTFSCSVSSARPSIAVIALSGVMASGFDQEVGGNGVSATPQPGSITPSFNNSIVIDAVANDEGTNNLNVDSSMSTPDRVLSNGNHVGLVMAYKIQTTAAAINPQWSNASGALHWAGANISFKEAVAGVLMGQRTFRRRGR